jgi:hypothetical protein
MRQPRRLLLVPDWPRVRRLVAEQLGVTEEQVDRMRDGDDSLERASVVTAVEEVLEELRRES